MIEIPAPAALIGPLLEQELAAAGMPSTVAVSDGRLILANVTELQRDAATSVVGAHDATASSLLAQRASERANETTIRERADSALATNTTFLAIASPTNAQLAAQVKALTRQNNGLIRLVLRRFDATD